MMETKRLSRYIDMYRQKLRILPSKSKSREYLKLVVLICSRLDCIIARENRGNVIYTLLFGKVEH